MNGFDWKYETVTDFVPVEQLIEEFQKIASEKAPSGKTLICPLTAGVPIIVITDEQHKEVEDAWNETCPRSRDEWHEYLVTYVNEHFPPELDYLAITREFSA